MEKRHRKLFVKVTLLGGIAVAIAVLGTRYRMHTFLPTSIGSEMDNEATEVCIISDAKIPEASGLAISRNHENSVWIHNDSGDGPRLFLVGLDGHVRAFVAIQGLTRPTDWEDMCSFELDGENWLLVGDIGDNGHVRGKDDSPCLLLLLKEPNLDASQLDARELTPIKDTVEASIEFTYPDGAINCESLAVDTVRREILLVSKTDPLTCRVFRLPLSLKPGKHTEKAESVANIGVPYATGMDVSPDGRRMAIINMFSGALINRAESESWSDACRKPVTVLTLPARAQGETVCFEADGQSILLNSEGVNQPLWRVSLENTAE